MKLIKLDAIDSTNDFLKKMAQDQALENFTVILAKTQNKGRGQQGSVWLSEPGKNLITSILISKTLSNIKDVFLLNISVALSITNVLEELKISSISIKWPNDIMAGKNKIAGVLIENLIKENGKIESIVGIGLNVNQKNFEDLTKASSLRCITDKEFDIEDILNRIIQKLKFYVQKIINKDETFLWKNYHEKLFKNGVPMAFENELNERFMGIIQGVNQEGKLEVLLEDDTIKKYGIKEIKMLY
ncbi:biotin--[acetyl-CoA-carboxylase] ligase [Flavobacterium terrae]|uniref:BirA family transcriptional regulator, biotin operon repressor / biotin-[acetyl-CoA-carboxylase] ligase n=1 Tax=Flavobacterium terrae TaxID=415425 RepID=A0A1M6F3K1_9FLAO|nr:biotin--[acetyl-CoA-carboxylase] ligase [Flavobacterium terrae]SHI92277.1 BirA family transcriptional regulator, biotin operon repressor / biotin-[acetyl-CoA-carboxylase] ligase [Flavobacterium terrae]